jgi:phosphatidate phosphatase APP1
VPLEIHSLGEQGTSVISDIDDTIKVSEVLDRSALLKNTFCRPFKPVDGMAGVYRNWEQLHGARFHYVTASPWQLYLPLSDFTRSNAFPAGTWHMKDFRVKDRSVLSLFASPERYKPGVIEPLLRRFPKRQFVLVGDSGEKDPEIYGALARKHPGQIRCILIRDVTGESAASPRYEKAFARLPRELWQIFKEPREIRDALSALPQHAPAR